eukprot:g1324.t1
MSGSSSARQNAHLAGQEEVERLTDELEKVSAERERFCASNVSLTAECAQLRAANAKLQEKYDKLLQQVRQNDQKRSAPETQDDKMEQAEGQACLASGVLFSALFEEGPLGAVFGSFENSTIVHSVKDGGQAYRHGVKFGDRVVGIVVVDTQKVTKIAHKPLREVFDILRDTQRPYEIQFERGCFSEATLHKFSVAAAEGAEKSSARTEGGSISDEDELEVGQGEEQEEDEHENTEVGGSCSLAQSRPKRQKPPELVGRKIWLKCDLGDGWVMGTIESRKPPQTGESLWRHKIVATDNSGTWYLHETKLNFTCVEPGRERGTHTGENKYEHPFQMFLPVDAGCSDDSASFSSAPQQSTEQSEVQCDGQPERHRGTNSSQHCDVNQTAERPKRMVLHRDIGGQHCWVLFDDGKWWQGRIAAIEGGSYIKAHFAEDDSSHSGYIDWNCTSIGEERGKWRIGTKTGGKRFQGCNFRMREPAAAGIESSSEVQARQPQPRYVGVRKTGHGKYEARINLKGTRHHLGYFACAEDAARAYDRAALKAGSQRPLNFEHEQGQLQLSEAEQNIANEPACGGDAANGNDVSTEADDEATESDSDCAAGIPSSPRVQPSRVKLGRSLVNATCWACLPVISGGSTWYKGCVVEATASRVTAHFADDDVRYSGAIKWLGVKAGQEHGLWYVQQCSIEFRMSEPVRCTNLKRRAEDDPPQQAMAHPPKRPGMPRSRVSCSDTSSVNCSAGSVLPIGFPVPEGELPENAVAAQRLLTQRYGWQHKPVRTPLGDTHYYFAPFTSFERQGRHAARIVLKDSGIEAKLNEDYVTYKCHSYSDSWLKVYRNYVDRFQDGIGDPKHPEPEAEMEISNSAHCVSEQLSNSHAISCMANADKNEPTVDIDPVLHDTGGSAGNEVDEVKSASPDAASLQASSVALNHLSAQERATAHDYSKATAGTKRPVVERAPMQAQKARVGSRWRVLVFLARLAEPKLVRQLRDHLAHRRRPCRALIDCSCELCTAAVSCALCPKWRGPRADNMENAKETERCVTCSDARTLFDETRMMDSNSPSYVSYLKSGYVRLMLDRGDGTQTTQSCRVHSDASTSTKKHFFRVSEWMDYECRDWKIDVQLVPSQRVPNRDQIKRRGQWCYEPEFIPGDSNSDDDDSSDDGTMTDTVMHSSDSESSDKDEDKQAGAEQSVAGSATAQDAPGVQQPLLLSWPSTQLDASRLQKLLASETRSKKYRQMPVLCWSMALRRGKEDLESTCWVHDLRDIIRELAASGDEDDEYTRHRIMQWLSQNPKCLEIFQQPLPSRAAVVRERAAGNKILHLAVAAMDHRAGKRAIGRKVSKAVQSTSGSWVDVEGTITDFSPRASTKDTASWTFTHNNGTVEELGIAELENALRHYSVSKRAATKETAAGVMNSGSATPMTDAELFLGRTSAGANMEEVASGSSDMPADAPAEFAASMTVTGNMAGTVAGAGAELLSRQTDDAEEADLNEHDAPVAAVAEISAAMANDVSLSDAAAGVESRVPDWMAASETNECELSVPAAEAAQLTEAMVAAKAAVGKLVSC